MFCLTTNPSVHGGGGSEGTLGGLVEWFNYLSTITAMAWSVPTTARARARAGRWRVGKTEGPKWPVSRIRIRVPTFTYRDKGGRGLGGEA
jgi:hypothetical protein